MSIDLTAFKKNSSSTYQKEFLKINELKSAKELLIYTDYKLGSSNEKCIVIPIREKNQGYALYKKSKEIKHHPIAKTALALVQTKKINGSLVMAVNIKDGGIDLRTAAIALRAWQKAFKLHNELTLDVVGIEMGQDLVKGTENAKLRKLREKVLRLGAYLEKNEIETFREDCDRIYEELQAMKSAFNYEHPEHDAYLEIGKRLNEYISLARESTSSDKNLKDYTQKAKKMTNKLKQIHSLLLKAEKTTPENEADAEPQYDIQGLDKIKDFLVKCKTRIRLYNHVLDSELMGPLKEEYKKVNDQLSVMELL